MLVIWIIGFCMMAACRNVETYAAAQVFSMVGYEGSRPSRIILCCDANLNETLAPKV
jgi:hypothetical protein